MHIYVCREPFLTMTSMVAIGNSTDPQTAGVDSAMVFIQGKGTAYGCKS